MFKNVELFCIAKCLDALRAALQNPTEATTFPDFITGSPDLLRLHLFKKSELCSVLASGTSHLAAGERVTLLGQWQNKHGVWPVSS